MVKFIDIHAHLNFPQFDEDRQEVIARMKEEGIACINIGTNTKTSREILDLANQNENMWAIVGIHPTEASVDSDLAASISKIENLIEQDNKNEQKKIVGIGECGLDFFRLNGGKEEYEKRVQRELFKAQISLAQKYDLPLMIHCRDAYDETLDILEQAQKRSPDSQLRVNFHFFAGDQKHFERILDLGFNISFTGVITFAQDYEKFVKAAPRDRIMSETDCPYVAPNPHRGERNEPTYVKHVAAKIIKIRGENEAFYNQLLQNAENFFKIKLK